MYTYDKVFTAQTTDATTGTLDWDGGEGQLIAAGTWDGAEVKLEISPDSGTTWVEVGDDGELDEDGVFSFRANPCKLRVKIEDTDSSTSLNVWITSEEYGSSKA